MFTYQAVTGTTLSKFYSCDAYRVKMNNSYIGSQALYIIEQ